MLFFMSTSVFALDIELRTYKNRVCYDGDTCYITISVLPGRLQKMSVRILGIDTPEIRGKCPEEKNLALRARIFANKVFENGKHTISMTFNRYETIDDCYTFAEVGFT